MKKPVMLIVLDGWGHREEKENNAILGSNTPVFNNLWQEYPHTLLDASGLAVGLPEGQIGTSEVGHTTIGAGTVVDTDLVRINKEIESGEFKDNSVINKTLQHAKDNNSTLHLMGLVSHGGVHSIEEHLHELIKNAQEFGVSKIKLHVFTDGRDCSPTSGVSCLKELDEGLVATLSGRYYAMDRDKNWDRTEKAFEAIFQGNGHVSDLKPSEELQRQYDSEITDEYVEPFVFGGYQGVEDNDSIFFFNFRADRARQLTELVLKEIEGKSIHFSSMTKYEDHYNIPVAYPDIEIKQTLAGVISDAGLKQSHLAETEKFAHATYFLNGGREEPYPNEKQIIAPSRKDVKTHDEAPEMRAEEIADKAVGEIKAGQDFIFINFANADMVGHTGNVPAIIKAVETVDRELGRVLDALEESGGVAFITADHGNAEINKDKNGGVHTAHTLSKVPAIITQKDLVLREDLGLSNIAPTILKLMNLEIPEGMDSPIIVDK